MRMAAIVRMVLAVMRGGEGGGCAVQKPYMLRLSSGAHRIIDKSNTIRRIPQIFCNLVRRSGNRSRHVRNPARMSARMSAPVRT